MMLIKISTSDDNRILILQSTLMWNKNIIILIVPLVFVEVYWEWQEL